MRRRCIICGQQPNDKYVYPRNLAEAIRWQRLANLSSEKGRPESLCRHGCICSSHLDVQTPSGVAVAAPHVRSSGGMPPSDQDSSGPQSSVKWSVCSELQLPTTCQCDQQSPFGCPCAQQSPTGCCCLTKNIPSESSITQCTNDTCPYYSEASPPAESRASKSKSKGTSKERGSKKGTREKEGKKNHSPKGTASEKSSKGACTCGCMALCANICGNPCPTTPPQTRNGPYGQQRCQGFFSNLNSQGARNNANKTRPMGVPPLNYKRTPCSQSKENTKGCQVCIILQQKENDKKDKEVQCPLCPPRPSSSGRVYQSFGSEASGPTTPCCLPVMGCQSRGSTSRKNNAVNVLLMPGTRADYDDSCSCLSPLHPSAPAPEMFVQESDLTECDERAVFPATDLPSYRVCRAANSDPNAKDSADAENETNVLVLEDSEMEGCGQQEIQLAEAQQPPGAQQCLPDCPGAPCGNWMDDPATANFNKVLELQRARINELETLLKQHNQLQQTIQTKVAQLKCDEIGKDTNDNKD
ncbi:hypothetical protein KR018_004015, partial [Drosophila ironensis]